MLLPTCIRTGNDGFDRSIDRLGWLISCIRFIDVLLLTPTTTCISVDQAAAAERHRALQLLRDVQATAEDVFLSGGGGRG